MSRRTRIVALVVAGVIGIGTTSALATWTKGGTGTGNATAAQLSTPGAPTQQSVTSVSASITWAAATAGSATVKYFVERAEFGGSTWSAACGSTLSAPISGVSCSDSGLSASHDYQFRVTAVVSKWQNIGGTSLKITTSAPSISIGNLSDGSDYAGNNGGGNTQWPGVISGTVANGQTVTLQVQEVTGPKWAIGTGTSNRFTSPTAVNVSPNPTITAGTNWSFTFAKQAFDAATDYLITATASGGGTASVTIHWHG